MIEIIIIENDDNDGRPLNRNASTVNSFTLSLVNFDFSKVYFKSSIVSQCYLQYM